MQITTVHALTFSMRCVGNEQHTAAVSIIRLGARTLGVSETIMSNPLPEGEDVSTRSSSVEVTSGNIDKLELYWNQLQAALALVGVEATSP